MLKLHLISFSRNFAYFLKSNITNTIAKATIAKGTRKEGKECSETTGNIEAFFCMSTRFLAERN